MRIRNKIAYGIIGLLGFMPMSVLVILQSIFALQASYDSKLVIDANEISIVDIIVYNQYNQEITDLIDSAVDEDGKPLLFSIIEATDTYTILEFQKAKVAEEQVEVLGMQFILSDGTKTEVLQGIIYLQYKNIVIDGTDPNWSRDAWIRDFSADMLMLYRVWYEQPQGTISYIWLKIIAASAGTLLGIVTVLFVVLRKSTKALVKRYWRIAVLVALIEGTIVLGLITWIVGDMFRVFAAATMGWAMFLGSEHIAKIKGYLNTASTTDELPEVLPVTVRADIEATVESILGKYRK